MHKNVNKNNNKNAYNYIMNTCSLPPALLTHFQNTFCKITCLYTSIYIYTHIYISLID